MSNRPRKHGAKSLPRPEPFRPFMADWVAAPLPTPKEEPVLVIAPEAICPPPAKSRWNDTGLLELLQAIKDNPHFWPEDSRLKYLEVRIDTRDMGFVLWDRDRKAVTPDDVMNAITANKARWDKMEAP